MDNNIVNTKLHKILSESYSNLDKPKPHIIYEEGPPYNYMNEFKELWLAHMEYLRLIQNFPFPKANERIFNESLNKFITEHDDARLFVAKEKKNLIGFLQAGIVRRNSYAFISDLHVSEKYRNLEIGSTLLENCFKWFKKNNINEVDVEVTGGNERVVKFYQRHSFEPSSYVLKKKS